MHEHELLKNLAKDIVVGRGGVDQLHDLLIDMGYPNMAAVHFGLHPVKRNRQNDELISTCRERCLLLREMPALDKLGAWLAKMEADAISWRGNDAGF